MHQSVWSTNTKTKTNRSIILSSLSLLPSDQVCEEIYRHYKETGFCWVNFLYFANVMNYRLCEPGSIYYNNAYAQALRASDLLLPDGIAIQMFASYGWFVAGRPHNLNGTDLIPQLLRYLSKQGTVSLYLYSVYDTTIDKDQVRLFRAAKNLAEQYGVTIQACYQELYQDRWRTFPWEQREQATQNDTAHTKVWIHATWSPFQEQWIATHYDRLRTMFGGIHLAAWGFLDFVSGFERRAPQRVVSARVLETPRRVITQPKKNLKKFLVMFGIVRYWRYVLRSKGRL
jgi:exopolysaccharide biosynthesis WecB/TagA/CpsF family protein